MAGLAASAALAEAGHDIHLFESRNFLGGRATSWPVSGDTEVIDNCQHVLIKCCHNLLDLYGRLGVGDKVEFHKEFVFMEPGGRTSTLKRGIFPAPAHFLGSFLTLKFLNFSDKLSVALATKAISKERHRKDLDRISMLDWLHEKKQSHTAIERYWRQILVSAINEELDQMAASHGLQVFWLGMISRSDSYEMGLPSVPLRDLYDERTLAKLGVTLHPRAPVTAIETDGARIIGIVAGDQRHTADHYVSALPVDRVKQFLPSLPIDWDAFNHSPITGIHLWFDRPITDLPHVTLLDRHIQWLFNKHEGRYLQLVVSASRSMVDMSRQAVIDLALRELADFFPLVKQAKLEKAHVIKEIRATFSARPNLEALRPLAVTKFENFFLAGDWTRSGWPATMEGAVRSGYLAAEAVTGKSFLIPDIA